MSLAIGINEEEYKSEEIQIRYFSGTYGNGLSTRCMCFEVRWEDGLSVRSSDVALGLQAFIWVACAVTDLIPQSTVEIGVSDREELKRAAIGMIDEIQNGDERWPPIAESFLKFVIRDRLEVDLNKTV